MPTRFELKREFQFKRSDEDLLFFVSNFWKAMQLGKGWLPFTPYPYQVPLITEMQDAIHSPGHREVNLKARQIGFTTIGSAAAFWDAFFHEDHPWLIVSQGLDESKRTLQQKVLQPYSHLPRWLQKRGPKIIRETAESIEFDNGSSITSIPSTASSGRGQAVWGTIFDEAAFMEDPDGVFAALDPLTYGPMFVFSTANGMGNFFHETYLTAGDERSVWTRRFYPWSVVPDRDDEWYANKEATYINREHLLAQEYPSTDVEAFLKSGRVALPVEDMQNAFCWCEPDTVYDLALVNDIDGETFTRAKVTDGRRPDLELRVWEPPHIERDEHGRVLYEPNYVVGVDVAEGLEHGDFSAIVVADAHTGNRVATAKAHIPIHMLGMLCAAIGYWYHNALLIVERNNHGIVPLEYLRTHNYPRLYRMEQLASQRRTDRTPRYGWVTSSASKPTLVHDYVKAITARTIELHDRALLAEATTFLSDGKGGFGAKEPNHDDMIIADMITHRGTIDVGKFPPIFYDPQPGPPTMGDLFSHVLEDEPEVGVALSKPIGSRTIEPDVIRSFEIATKERS